MLAFPQFAPIALANLDAIILRRFLDVRECQIAIIAGNVLNLIEAGERVVHVTGILRFFALVGKGEDTVGQIALVVSFPCSV